MSKLSIGLDGTATSTQQAATPLPSSPVANMEQAGILKGIEQIKIMDIPIGPAILGGTLAFATDALFDRFLPQVTGSTANILAALALVMFGKQFLGESARYAAMFLAYEAVRGPIESALLPILKPSQALSQPWTQPMAQQYGDMGQKSAVSSDFYSFALGG